MSDIEEELRSLVKQHLEPQGRFGVSVDYEEGDVTVFLTSEEGSEKPRLNRPAFDIVEHLGYRRNFPVRAEDTGGSEHRIYVKDTGGD
ncbi:MAG: hypothetical protein ABEI58_01245 [Candidatus Nanohaloarchaea archaeon]